MVGEEGEELVGFSVAKGGGDRGDEDDELVERAEESGA